KDEAVVLLFSGGSERGRGRWEIQWFLKRSEKQKGRKLVSDATVTWSEQRGEKEESFGVNGRSDGWRR
ncbi:hypothetical protein HAX54_047576, partial [Datura stramonium]|nr:hypothetical protein [Datura stramonium]